MNLDHLRQLAKDISDMTKQLSDKSIADTMAEGSKCRRATVYYGPTIFVESVAIRERPNPKIEINLANSERPHWQDQFTILNTDATSGMIRASGIAGAQMVSLYREGQDNFYIEFRVKGEIRYLEFNGTHATSSQSREIDEELFSTT